MIAVPRYHAEHSHDMGVILFSSHNSIPGWKPKTVQVVRSELATSLSILRCRL